MFKPKPLPSVTGFLRIMNTYFAVAYLQKRAHYVHQKKIILNEMKSFDEANT
jgi:hypothetical protein